ncbi:MAG: hypothetical protein IAF08_12560 [Rhizobacter sp.]|nr:hypothetical protein [Chlorobiales bacterium]
MIVPLFNALLILVAGADGLSGESRAPLWSSILNLTVGSVMLMKTFAEWKKPVLSQHPVATSINIIFSVLPILTAMMMFNAGKKFLPFAYLFTGSLFIWLNVQQRWWPMSLVLSPHGMTAQLSPLRRLSLPWPDLKHIRTSELETELVMQSGKSHRINFARLENGDIIQAKLCEAAASHGVSCG